MKRSELIFGAILVPIDFGALLLAGSLAYVLRTSGYVQRIRPAVFELELPFFSYLELVTITSLAVVGVFAWQGLYTMQVTRRLLDEWTRIFSGISIAIMGVIVYIFLSAELFQSRFILLGAYVLGILFVLLGRWVVRIVQLSALRRGLGVHRVTLVGNGKFAQHLAELFARRTELGYHVVAVLDRVQRSELERIYREQGIDEVIKTDAALPEEDNLVLLDFCDAHKIGYRYVPDLFETYAAHLRFQQIGGVPMMELLRTPLDGWGRVAKRIMDVLGAVFGLVVLAPLFLVTAILVQLDSHGPVFFRQIRLGRNMAEFEIFKFRSMKIEYCTGDRYSGSAAKAYEAQLRKDSNERTGPLFKMKNDPRITKVGKWLRKTRIDELPQLINVWRGEMSLIGPRPHLPEEVLSYTKYHRKLFTIKPGMSGMAQVNGNAGLPFEQEAKLDIGYIEDWSLRLDIILLLKTLRILLSDKNAV